MSTLKSSAENLTLNADGANNDIKFQSNGVEKASIDQDGVIATGGASLDGAVTINDTGADVDFRVESDSVTHALFVDGATGNVGLGDSDPSEAKLSITGVQAGDVGVKIDHDIVDTHALQIAADNTTARGVDVECNAVTTGSIAKFYSNASNTSTRELVVIANDHVAATGTTALYVQQDSEGYALIIDQTGHNTSGDESIYMKLGANCNDTSSYFLRCWNGTAGQAFHVLGTGNCLNQNNSYAGISDLKLKENIVDANSQWEDIKALQIKNYSLKVDNLDEPNKLGVIAQDLEASGMNGLIEETSDIEERPDSDWVAQDGQTEEDRPNIQTDLGTTTKNVKYSILYMKSVKALQEAIAKIETLEAKVTALENA